VEELTDYPHNTSSISVTSARHRSFQILMLDQTCHRKWVWLPRFIINYTAYMSTG